MCGDAPGGRESTGGAYLLEVQSFGQKCLPAPHRTATTKIFTGILPASNPHYRHVTGIKNTINHDNAVMLMEIHDRLGTSAIIKQYQISQF